MYTSKRIYSNLELCCSRREAIISLNRYFKDLLESKNYLDSIVHGKDVFLEFSEDRKELIDLETIITGIFLYNRKYSDSNLYENNYDQADELKKQKALRWFETLNDTEKENVRILSKEFNPTLIATAS